MLVCFLNFLLNGEYSNLLVVAVFCNSFFFSKPSSLVKNSYLPTFLDDKTGILAVTYLNCIELSFAQFCYHLF